jgi:hypothetical protein
MIMTNLNSFQQQLLINEFGFVFDNFSKTLNCGLVDKNLLTISNYPKYPKKYLDNYSSFSPTFGLNYRYEFDEGKLRLSFKFYQEHRGKFSILDFNTILFLKINNEMLSFEVSDIFTQVDRYDNEEYRRDIIFDCSDLNILKKITNNNSLEFSIKFGGDPSIRINGILDSNNVVFIKLKKLLILLFGESHQIESLTSKSVSISTEKIYNKQDETHTNDKLKYNLPKSNYSENWFQGQSIKDILVLVVPIVLIIIYCLKSC